MIIRDEMTHELSQVRASESRLDFGGLVATTIGVGIGLAVLGVIVLLIRIG